MNTLPYLFDIDIVIDNMHLLDTVAASTFKGYPFPDGELPPSEKDVIWTDQMIADYEAFLDTLEEMLTDYYGFYIYYENYSEDMSKYFGLLAKDDNGDIIFRFRFRLRVSNHSAHRSKESQKNKKEETAALNRATNGKRLKPRVKYIVVNKDTFASYDDAIEYIDKVIEGVIHTMVHRCT